MKPGKSYNLINTISLAYKNSVYKKSILYVKGSKSISFIFLHSPIIKLCSLFLTAAAVQVEEHLNHCLFVLTSIPSPFSTVSQAPLLSLAKFSQMEALVENCRVEGWEKPGHFSFSFPLMEDIFFGIFSSLL